MAKPQTKHLEYVSKSPQWVKCRAAIEGEDAIHAGGINYLPKLSGQSAIDYAAYTARTPFYNATGRTIDGLTGMVFRKQPIVKVPAAIDAYMLDMTLTNCDLNELAENITREVLSVGRVGVLVEYPQINEQPASLAQANAQNLRPYCTIYQAESITNWRITRVNNLMQAVMVTLYEKETQYTSEFEYEEIEQYRALFLKEGVYSQQLYRKDGKSHWLPFGDVLIPIMNGKPLSTIPFVFFGANDNSAALNTPPLYDLVTLNLSHYRTSADLEHGAHFTGLPTAVISGYQVSEGEKFAIGSSTAWVFPDPSAKASYLEFTGQGLGTLEKLKKEKEQAMASLGARMLAAEKSGVEAAQAIRLRHSGESAVLSSIVNMINAGLMRVLTIMAEWTNVSGEIKVELNRDFIENSLSAQELTALVAAWQSGSISYATLFWNLKQGELIEAKRTLEEEQGELETASPVLAQ